MHLGLSVKWFVNSKRNFAEFQNNAAGPYTTNLCSSHSYVHCRHFQLLFQIIKVVAHQFTNFMATALQLIYLPESEGTDRKSSPPAP